MFHSVLEITLIVGSTGVVLLAEAVLLVVFPVADVLAAVGIGVDAEAFDFVPFEIALISVAILEIDYALTVGLVLPELALIPSVVGFEEDAVAISLVVEPFSGILVSV